MKEGNCLGRVAVVTGGASGIGLAIVRRLAAGGASVALLDLDEAAADQAAVEKAPDRHIVPLSGIIGRPVSPRY